jgi:hypothetical protein
MENYKLITSLIATIIGLASYVPYVAGIIKGKVKPSAATWMTWTLLTAIAFAGQLSGGGGIGVLTIGSSALASLIVAALALRDKKSRKFTRFDRACLAAALLAIGVWPIAHSALLSEALVTGVTVVGYIPTFIKSHARPTEENVSMYLIGIIKFGLSALTLTTFSAVTLLYPIVIGAANAVLISVLLVRRKQLATEFVTQEAFSAI